MKSIVKFALRISTIVILSFRISSKHKALIIKVRPYKSENLKCPICHKKCRAYDAKNKPKLWRAMDFLCIKCYIEYAPVRVKCPKHGVHVQYIPWARHNSVFTKPFEDWVAYLAVQCTKSAVSALARINWRTVGNICERVYGDLEKQRGAGRFDNLKRIGIDETSYKTGHKYMTVIVDHDTARLVWAHPGKGSATLELFFEQLTKEQRSSIEVITADGARWIKKVVKKYCKEAIYCMDPFHVVSWMNDALDEVRRQEWNAAKAASNALKPSKRKKAGRPPKIEQSKEYKEAAEAAKAIKKTRWALLKGYENLTEAQEQKIKGLKNTADNHLFKSWEFKEDLRSIFQCHDVDEAEDMLDDWLHRAAYCKIKPVVEVEKKIRRRKNDVLQAIALGLGNGRIEAINNKIKVTIKMGYGFRNTDNLIALLMLKCSDIQPQLPFMTAKDFANIKPEKAA